MTEIKKISFFNLQIKLLLIVVIICFFLLGLALIGKLSFQTIEKTSTQISEVEIPHLRTINECLYAVTTSQIAVEKALDTNKYSEISQVNQFELAFNKSANKSEMFLAAMTWGSESKAFAQSQNGRNEVEWQKANLKGKLRVKQLSPEKVQVASLASIYFAGFRNNAVKAITTHKLYLQLLEEGKQIEAIYLESRVYADKSRFYADQSEILLNQINKMSNDEIGEAEDLIRNTYDTASFRLTIFGILGLLVIIVIYVVSTKLTIIGPLKKLLNATEQINVKNLFTQVEITSKDEFGQLGQAFNNMASRLQQSYAAMDQQVAEKTTELSKKITELDKTNSTIKKTGLAMMNILEDEKDLEIALKKEKESVEKKVEQRTLELSNTKAKLSASIENLPLGFLMSDIEENLIVTNSLANQILEGQNSNEKLVTLKNILKNKVDITSYIKNCGIDKNHLSFDDIQINNHYFRFMLSPILTDNPPQVCLGIVILIQDITEAKIVDRSKDEFFSIASHELRTPLTAIRGNTSMILEYYSKAVEDPELKAMIDDIHESSIRLINIVNDFLNVSRLEQGKMDFDKKEFKIDELISEVIAEYKTTGSQKNLSIEYIDTLLPPPVMADSDKTRQILTNLIGNALKFTNEGGIKIATMVSGKFVNVSVSDTGRGIPLKQQGLLFRRFQQAGENLFTRDTVGGTGLGLYISRLMIEGMGGKIWVEKSEEGKGSTFSFSLPIVKTK